MLIHPFHYQYRNRWAGSVKSQIFVRKNKSQTQPINIDLFSSGQDLLHVLAEKLGEDINENNVMFGTKQVKNIDQIFNGSLDLYLVQVQYFTNYRSVNTGQR